MYERPDNRRHKPCQGNEIRNTRSQNEYNRWEQNREHGVHFLEDQNKDWMDLMGPIMERAMETLEERMWQRYRRGIKVDQFHRK